ncbi:MAG: hypothetical protein RID53_07005 [Coleofasciculus sp. B1-GNL1-01]|uniref:P-loop NTPase n=1 Tax=Coleofasciculus sp. B1-GNL1-01 TaxID=3068484 RepID=UPI0032F750EF
MTEYSKGRIVQENAKRILAALLDVADGTLERQNSTKKPLTVRPQTDPPGLFVTYTINSLVELTENDQAEGGLTYAKVESAIKFLEGFGIVQRPDNQQGSTQQLTIRLWETDKQKNLIRFDAECDTQRRQTQTRQGNDPWGQVRKVVPPEFDLLDQKFFHKRRGGETRILKLPSVSKNWSLITQGNYIDRDQQGEVFAQAEALANYSGISLLLIRGQPGAGKTALMQWLAYELSGQHRLVLQKKREEPYWLDPLWEFSEQIHQHFYLIADDVFRDDSILEELENNELQFPLTVIGTTRLNEDQQDKLRLRGYRIESLDLELSPLPESQEKQRILDRICQEDGEAKARLEKMAAAERKQLMAAPSMLVLMLQLSEGKPFDLIVADVIRRLPSDEDYPVYQVFGVICSFYQYSIITPTGVLPLCLPNYSKKAVRDVVDFARDAELKGLVNIIWKAGYDGFATIHELIAQTAMTVKYPRSRGENLPYSPNLLEDYLRAAIPALKATKETHQRWAYHGLRLLAVNGEVTLVRQVVDDYSNQIQSLQHKSGVSGWFTWSKMYESVGLLSERDRCLDAILSTEPQSSSEWVYWLSLIQRRGKNEQKQEAIALTSSWLQLHPDDFHVRTKYLALIGQLGTNQQKQEAIALTSSWLQLHPDDTYVRTQYLALIGQFGTSQQKQNAIAKTSSWLQLHPDDSWVRTKYLALIGQFGTSQQKQEAIAKTSSWLQLHPDDSWVRTQYLALIGQCGTSPQKQEVIALTSSWLQLHPDNSHVRRKYLALIGQFGTTRQKQEAIAHSGFQYLVLIEQCGTLLQKQEAIALTTTWLQLHPYDREVRRKYLALIEQCGTPPQKQEAIALTTTWLQLHPDDITVREKYLALIGQCGTSQQKQEAIAQTSSWLQLHPDDTNVRTQYLALIGQCGTTQQKQEAIALTTTWLQLYPDDHEVRTTYLAVVGKAGKDIIDIEPIIIQQWQWISQQAQVDQSLWTAFLPVLYYHAQPRLIQKAVNLVLQQYPKDATIICLIFGYFQNDLDYETCYRLADLISQSRLHTSQWQSVIYAANFFRDCGELDKATEIYQRTIKSAKFRIKKYGDDLQKTVNFASLNYAFLLLLRQPPDPYTVMDYLQPTLTKTPKHCVAHWYMARCYQAQGHNYSSKGRKVYQQAIKHFQQAIKFDNQKNGHFWYEFGCFYRDAMQNPTEARTCFENSLNQTINLRACVDLAELELADGNFDRARELLQQGLALVPMTRPEREQRDRLESRIQGIQAQLDD